MPARSPQFQRPKCHTSPRGLLAMAQAAFLPHMPRPETEAGIIPVVDSHGALRLQRVLSIFITYTIPFFVATEHQLL